MRFEPLHPASRSTLIVGVVIGPLLWLVVLAAGAWLFEYSWAIALGLLVVVVIVRRRADRLSACCGRARVRQEKRYVDSR